MTPEQFDSVMAFVYKQGRADEAAGKSIETVTVTFPDEFVWLKEYFPTTEKLYQYAEKK